MAVIGLPDPEWGELVCAVVVPAAAPGSTEPGPTTEALRSHCAERLARYKHPRRVALAEALPRTAATAQVQRALLVQQIQTGALEAKP